jgi:hypothetical protein
MVRLPIAYRLYLPHQWIDDPGRRAAAGLPDDIVFQTEPHIAVPNSRLEGLDRNVGGFLRLARPVVLAAVDGKPSDAVFVLLVPFNSTTQVYLPATASGHYHLATGANGTISLPLVGSLKAEGASADQLAGRVKAALVKGKLLKAPSVFAEVATYRPIFALGEVSKPDQPPTIPA